MVFFLLDTVPRLDLSRFYAPYEEETRGAPPYNPAMMLCLRDALARLVSEKSEYLVVLDPDGAPAGSVTREDVLQ